MSLISIIIPMRNAEAWIAETLRSILAQRDVELDIVVINDGSTDRSVDAVQSVGDARIRVLPGPQRGISAAFNAGLAAARGEYVARCDADDLYPAGRLAEQLAWVEARPQFGAVVGYFTTIDPRGRVIGEQRHGDDRDDVTDELLAGVGRSHMCAYLYRTATLRAIGGCREWFPTSEDADLQYRLAGATRVGYQPINAYLYRLHDASITHTQASQRRLFYENCAKTFLAQRVAGGQDDLERGAPPEIPTDSGGGAAQSTAAQIQSQLIGQAWRLHRGGEKRASLGVGLRAIRSRPTSFSAWKSLAMLAVKRPGT